MRRTAGLSALVGAVFVAAIAWVVSRDPRLAELLIGFPNGAVEFDARRLLCNDFPACFRVGTNAVGSAMSLPGHLVTWSGIDFDAQTTWSGEESFRQPLANVISSVLWRAIALGLTWWGTFLILGRRVGESLLIFGSTLVLTSGLVGVAGLRVLDWVAPGMLPNWRVEVLYTELTRLVVNYDYAAVCATVLVAALLATRNQFIWLWSAWKFFGFSFLLALFWEYLGVLFIGSVLVFFRSELPPRSKIFAGLAGALLGPLSVYALATVLVGPSPNSLLETWRYYFGTNIIYWESLLEQILVAFLPLLVFGLMAGLLARRLALDPVSEQSRESFRAVSAVAMILSGGLIVAFFTSGLASEFTRQSLPLQFLVVLFCYLGASHKRRTRAPFQPHDQR